jgi:GNAT superfamily N-acetyltransferase
MITVRRAGLGNYKLVRNSLKSFNPSSYRFYSEFDGPFIIYILRRECWLIMDGSSLLGIIFTSPVRQQVYYIPVAKKHPSFMATAFFIKKYTKTTGYTLKLTYSSASFKAASAYLRVKPITNLKHMKCSISSVHPSSPILPHGIEIKPMRKGEESIRVELQNSIFGGNKNRTPLTVDEVIGEQRLAGYMGSMCYILKVNGKPVGYGQIMVSNCIYSLINFGIIPSFRGYGYGDTFLKYILYRCESAGIENLQLTVDNSNPAAIGLYKKNGFVELYNTADLIM